MQVRVISRLLLGLAAALGGSIAHAQTDTGSIERTIPKVEVTPEQRQAKLATPSVPTEPGARVSGTFVLSAVNIDGAIFHVPVSLPAPGVQLPPDLLQEFCTNVMLIELPGQGHNPVVRSPFLRGALPPTCNPNTQDLVWKGPGLGWECVTTLSGVCATSNDPGRPRWVLVTPNN